MKEKRIDQRLSGVFKNALYENIFFEHLVVQNARFEDVTFKNVHFFQCYLGFQSSYANVRFENCRFYGRYSTLGDTQNKLTTYQNVEFENCEIEGLDKFSGTHFMNCTFSGTFKNQIIYEHLNHDFNGTRFTNCDLRKVVFNNFNIYGNNIFCNSLLPISGIVILDNTNKKVQNYAENRIRDLEEIDKRQIEIILHMHRDHNFIQYIIIDDYLSSTFFSSEISRSIFLEIVERFRLNEVILKCKSKNRLFEAIKSFFSHCNFIKRLREIFKRNRII